MADEQSDSASKAATKVHEAAANVRQAQSGRKRITNSSAAESVARRYFQAIAARDLDTAVGLWANGGRDNIRGQMDVIAPEGVRAFLGEILDATPDLLFEILSTTTQDERCAVQYRISGTFAGPGTLNGIQPTGDRFAVEGIDLLTVKDGLIQSNEAFPDSIAIPRQLGMIPPQGSLAEQRLTGAFNAKTRLTSRLSGSEAQMVATGVWVVQGQPGRCNVYLIEHDGGVTMFDAGARTMTRSLARAGAKLGGISRIVLGHGHTDHRGAAPGICAPVFCHPAEVQDAEGSGGFRYWPEGLSDLPFPQRQMHKLMHRYAWDAGPVNIAGTLSEGDHVAGFSVVEIPGHAPGQIALWRESDRLALVSDCFYTIDMWGRDCDPHLPLAMYNFDTEQARASMLKLAALEPAAAWAGHAKPLTGDVRSQLQRAAEL
ncbi:MAG TPA: MBL fold metallo-hydrolase [Solirubrobacteraceae bacterium]|jgi:glyoxylase-like metal-dependent hydrolase (beta-lactamase superfamily II)/predicted ester cyclase|nr:MBL fold metallo-hydrolase [Solirubrobacteraceae bacterium]